MNHVRQEQDKNAGKYVLNDFMATPEVFEVVSVGVQGLKGAMRIELRSLRHREPLVVDSFYGLRTARSNEIRAKARQGSEAFEYFWQKQNQNFSY